MFRELYFYIFMHTYVAHSQIHGHPWRAMRPDHGVLSLSGGYRKIVSDLARVTLVIIVWPWFNMGVANEKPSLLQVFP